MIIFIYGPETYRSRQKLKFYREGFKKKYDPRGLNIEILDGEKLTFDIFRQKQSSQGLLSKKRLVIVENLILKNKSAKIQAQISDYLKETNLSADQILIFWEGDLGERRGRGKRLKAAGGSLLDYLLEKAKAEEFSLLSGFKLTNWVEEEVKKRKGKIANEAKELLIGLVGNDLWLMVNEIEKLINYKDGKMITKEDVSEFVKAGFDTDIFRLSDALAERKLKLALKLIHDQIESGENELYLLTMLTRQFRILLMVKDASREEGNMYGIASRLGLHPFVCQKALAQVKNFSLGELKDIYQKLMDIDLKIKTGQTEPKVLFDLFIFDVCKA
ncbi:MAG: DNA polymerase III subunit delta [Patescibacteria group bacterium]